MRKLASVILGFTAVCAMSVTAFAGTWQSDTSGWWYRRDDGSYPAGTWEWIDSNGDGAAECYYFYSDGYMAHNNDIDGYYVNDDGQWEVDGKVQIKGAALGGATVSGSRDMSYAQYLRGINSLWSGPSGKYQPEGFYKVYVWATSDAVVDRGDCFEVKGVNIELPYEFDTKAQAEAKLKELIRQEIASTGENGVYFYTEQNTSTGKYQVGMIDDAVYSYPVWKGSVYIRKDAVLSFKDYDLDQYVHRPFADELAKELRGEYGRVNAVIQEVDENGYVTRLLMAQWG